MPRGPTFNHKEHIVDIDALFDISAAKRKAMPESVRLLTTYDGHIHCRPKSTGQMEMVVRECLKAHVGLVDIANVPGIETTVDVIDRKREILSCVPAGQDLDLQVVPLISNTSDPVMWRNAFIDGHVTAVKVFWYGVSNSYGQSITSIRDTEEFFHIATKQVKGSSESLIITLHAECLKDYGGHVLPIKDREYWCMDNEVRYLVTRVAPHATYVIRHVSDYRTLELIAKWQAEGYRIHAELSPQYFIHIDDSIFTGEDGHAALMCNCVYWPRPKDARSRTAIQNAALEGYDWLHFGQDYAMHLEDPTRASGVKINNQGIAAGGLNLLPAVAKSLMLDFFVSRGKLDVYEQLAAINPANLYGFPAPDKHETYVRKDWTVDQFIFGKNAEGEGVKARCYLGGTPMHWQRAT